MESPEPNPYREFAFVRTDKPKPPVPPSTKPAPKYQSLTFLTIVIQGVYVLLCVALLVGTGSFFSLSMKFDEVKKLQALLQNPPPGTDHFQLHSANDKLKATAMELKNLSETLIITSAVMFAFSGILGLAFTGWVYKATTNLLALGVPKLVYSPLISALGMFLVPLFTAPFILNEIAKGSDPERLTRYGHRDHGVSLLVVAWSLAMVLSVGASFLLLTQMPTEQQFAAGHKQPTDG